mmetsp:Transcript_6515/g.13472  ORF Transcript_6515/g.13472 Transcript_6515/m.13472 type:complete len:373 (+) Transcript_6515:611-1729(+)
MRWASRVTRARRRYARPTSSSPRSCILTRTSTTPTLTPASRRWGKLTRCSRTTSCEQSTTPPASPRLTPPRSSTRCSSSRCSLAPSPSSILLASCGWPPCSPQVARVQPTSSLWRTNRNGERSFARSRSRGCSPSSAAEMRTSSRQRCTRMASGCTRRRSGQRSSGPAVTFTKTRVCRHWAVSMRSVPMPDRPCTRPRRTCAWPEPPSTRIVPIGRMSTRRKRRRRRRTTRRRRRQRKRRRQRRRRRRARRARRVTSRRRQKEPRAAGRRRGGAPLPSRLRSWAKSCSSVASKAAPSSTVARAWRARWTRRRGGTWCVLLMASASRCEQLTCIWPKRRRHLSQLEPLPGLRSMRPTSRQRTRGWRGSHQRIP